MKTNMSDYRLKLMLVDRKFTLFITLLIISHRKSWVMCHIIYLLILCLKFYERGVSLYQVSSIPEVTENMLILPKTCVGIGQIYRGRQNQNKNDVLYFHYVT